MSDEIEPREVQADLAEHDPMWEVYGDHWVLRIKATPWSKCPLAEFRMSANKLTGQWGWRLYVIGHSMIGGSADSIDDAAQEVAKYAEHMRKANKIIEGAIREHMEAAE